MFVFVGLQQQRNFTMRNIVKGREHSLDSDLAARQLTLIHDGATTAVTQDAVR